MCIRDSVTGCQAIIPAVRRVLDGWRAASHPVVHTLEAHLPDLSDCPASKLCGPRAPRDGWRIGQVKHASMGRAMIRGEPGSETAPELTPVAGERVVYKPGKGAFFGTELDKELQGMGVCGVTTEVCVQSTLREANDRGYECLLLADCTASYFPEFKESTLQMVASQGGLVGWVSDSTSLLAALRESSSVEVAEGLDKV
eukprot:TRINITY_DN13392_c0_g1_i1.p1 TRINITY_DN13392_c0_g1~~TRINITY_DN13392_c0_g1_i1.p1  ORF type:complete len:199 (-),score=45.21 TRINITY_DN13392_c0_g1_i1:188-784(-)